MTKAAITSKSPSVYPVFCVSCNLGKKKLHNWQTIIRPKQRDFFLSKVQCFERAELTEDHTIFRSSAGDNIAISTLSNDSPAEQQTNRPLTLQTGELSLLTVHLAHLNGRQARIDWGEIIEFSLGMTIAIHTSRGFACLVSSPMGQTKALPRAKPSG